MKHTSSGIRTLKLLMISEAISIIFAYEHSTQEKSQEIKLKTFWMITMTYKFAQIQVKDLKKKLKAIM